MEKIRAIARDIVRREGGFVDDPDDPGGATKHGVTLHTLRLLGLDLDGDRDVDRADVERVSEALAEEIFLKEYFEKPGISQLPEPMWATVFDMQVTQAHRRSEFCSGWFRAWGCLARLTG